VGWRVCKRGRVSRRPANISGVSRRIATQVWLRIALRSFGGPAGQIAVMHRELVDERKWIGEERFMHALSYCTLLPGPEAQQLAIYLGWLLNGTGGGLIAGTLFVLPGYLALMAISAAYVQWGATDAAAAIFAGVAPAVIAIVMQAVWRIGRRTLRHRWQVLVAAAAFVALAGVAVPFPIVIAAAALAGLVATRCWPSGAADSAVVLEPGPGPESGAVDEAGTWGRAARLLVIGLTLWFTPVAVSWAVFGRTSTFVEQGFFFGSSAVVTFGGAYAVLAYVAQRAVNVYGWLLPGEMVHGLAMAETTPGPLIMVVQFVGFLGAYRNPGDLNPWVAAVFGSTLVVWVTFVPSFLFVLLGAPHVEALRGNRRLSGALNGVMAAVVGVIANLGVYFAVHTIFDRSTQRRWGAVRVTVPVLSTFSPLALAVAGLAAVLVVRWKLGVLRVLAVCGALGAGAWWLAN
jgi:chromate transporter